MQTGGLSAALAATAILVLLTAGSPAIAGIGDCGPPQSGGTAPVATDALYTLAVAVGTQVCEACVCDVDGSGGTSPVSATDALITLRRAVDPQVVLSCIACEVSCDLSPAPECGGTCANGGTCAPEPTAPDECSCLGSCELGPAPVCGGACDGPNDDPSDVCTTVLVSYGSGEPEPQCLCLPEGVVACEDSEEFDCRGVCHSGSTCEEQNGSCVCVSQPEQGACSSAIAPTCAGVCGAGEICSDEEGTCACVAWTSGEQETCTDASVPTCGGACGDGRACAVEIGEGNCACHEPCQTGEPPTCGGACNEPGQVCLPTSVTIGSSTFDYCDCLNP